MEVEHNESDRSSDEENDPGSSGWTLVTDSSLVSNETTEKNAFIAIDPQITSNTEIEVMTNLWANVFKENPRTGTIKLFTVVINCFNVDVRANEFANFNSVLMFARIVKMFKIMDNNGLLCLPVTLKGSADVTKTLELVNSIFRHHSNLFFDNNINKSYYNFLKNILIKISQSDLIGPRFLATSFGLKIITGILQYNNLELLRIDLKLLLKEFLTKRSKDIACIIRETVLLEFDVWIKIDFNYFFNDYWMYIYESLSDLTANVQNLALKMSKFVLNLQCDNPNVKLLVKKIMTVLANLLLSKKEEVVMSAFELYSIIKSYSVDEEDEYEQCMSKIGSIALELMFSEKPNVAKFAAKHFVEEMVNVLPHESEKIKTILVVLQSIPSQLVSIATSFFVDALYEFCPVLVNFELISRMLNSENLIEKDKCNLMLLLMYVVQRYFTGINSKHEVANIRDLNDVIQLHTNTRQKRQFTTYLALHIINQLKDYKDFSHAFSLWCLIQFFDFELLQDKMILPQLFECVSSFYKLCDIPTVLEMVSRCTFVMISNLKNHEQNLCSTTIKDIATSNIGVLKAGIENSAENVPSLLIQKNALIRVWSLAKYNNIPDYLEPLKYLSYYIPNLNNTQANLVVSTFALSAYMEILRKHLLKVPNESTVENTFISFIDALLNILNKYDIQFIHLCETAFLIVDELLRIKFKTNKPSSSTICCKDKNSKLTNYIFHICRNYESNDDLSSSKLLKVYLKLIQDGLIELDHLMTPLQFVKKEFIERALRPVFNFFCKKETGHQLSCTIQIFLVYMFENVMCGKPGFRNSTVKDVTDVATIITRLLNQCTDQLGKRLVSTTIHRKGIQYAMNDVLNNSLMFKIFFWVLTSMCDTLVPYDAQQLVNSFLDKPAIKDCIIAGNEYVIAYVYKLEELCSN